VRGCKAHLRVREGDSVGALGVKRKDPLLTRASSCMHAHRVMRMGIVEGGNTGAVRDREEREDGQCE
jgi:hypothetical protein